MSGRQRLRSRSEFLVCMCKYIHIHISLPHIKVMDFTSLLLIKTNKKKKMEMFGFMDLLYVLSLATRKNNLVSLIQYSSSDWFGWEEMNLLSKLYCVEFFRSPIDKRISIPLFLSAVHFTG